MYAYLLRVRKVTFTFTSVVDARPLTASEFTHYFQVVEVSVIVRGSTSFLRVSVVGEGGGGGDWVGEGVR